MFPIVLVCRRAHLIQFVDAFPSVAIFGEVLKVASDLTLVQVAQFSVNFLP